MKIEERLARVSGIYLLTPDLATAEFSIVQAAVDSALQSGVQIIQYRSSDASRARKLARARALRELSARNGALLMIEGDVELAAEVEADGVHLGREDVSIAHARRRLGEAALIGVSCYADLALAGSAHEQGANLVSFGALFASKVKPLAGRAPLALLSEARRAYPTMKIVGVGGIDIATVGSVAAAGAQLAALITAVFSAAEPAVTVRALIASFKENEWKDERHLAAAV